MSRVAKVLNTGSSHLTLETRLIFSHINGPIIYLQSQEKNSLDIDPRFSSVGDRRLITKSILSRALLDRLSRLIHRFIFNPSNALIIYLMTT